MTSVDLRARKQTRDDALAEPATSGNGSSRPPLRLVHDATQVAEPQQQRPSEASPVGEHADDLMGAVEAHTVTSTLPPTLVTAASGLWLDGDEVRHGLAGQLAALAAGLVQLAGLAACWATAHVFFSTKTRAALFALVTAAALITFAVASHA